jgi:hypothetical protein
MFAKTNKSPSLYASFLFILPPGSLLLLLNENENAIIYNHIVLWVEDNTKGESFAAIAAAGEIYGIIFKKV